MISRYVPQEVSGVAGEYRFRILDQKWQSDADFGFKLYTQEQAIAECAKRNVSAEEWTPQEVYYPMSAEVERETEL